MAATGSISSSLFPFFSLRVKRIFSLASWNTLSTHTHTHIFNVVIFLKHIQNVCHFEPLSPERSKVDLFRIDFAPLHGNTIPANNDFNLRHFERCALFGSCFRFGGVVGVWGGVDSPRKPRLLRATGPALCKLHTLGDTRRQQ